MCVCVSCGCFVTAAQPPSRQALSDLEKIPRKTEEDNKAPGILGKALLPKTPTGTRTKKKKKLELFDGVVSVTSFFLKKRKNQ